MANFTHVTSENTECCILTLFVHNVCNFKCSYCNALHNSGSNKWPGDIAPYLELIRRLRESNSHIFVEILGGEPTYWPKFEEFLDRLAAPDVFFEFGTNASRPLSYWRAFRERPQFISLSWHAEEIDDDHFVAVAAELQGKASVHATLMTLPDSFNRAQKMFERLRGLDISVAPKLVRLNLGDERYFEYAPEQVKWITETNHNRRRALGIAWPMPERLHFDATPLSFMKVVHRRMNHFRGWTCSAGQRRLYVDLQGDIYRCTQREGVALGNIFGSYDLPRKPVVCSRQTCPCKFDALVEKWSPQWTR
ncbi:MAG TPA: radical SAM protein [Bdellovibrionales bacterium]|nr:radical SAM protein [Bdellovibrionales bacterium]